MSITTACIIGAVIALGATIAACILITPEKKRPQLNKYLQIVHDIFNFKDLLLDKILKVLYVFSTLFCIAGGFFMLFSGYHDYWTGGFHSFALYGILLIIIGPFVVRIMYESFMMFILITKNVIDINNKLKKNAAPTAESEPVVEPKMIYCSVCGTKYDANNGGCPNGCKPE